jgi:hypothetical protein
MCLPSRFLAMNIYSDFTIPAFRRHVTISQCHILSADTGICRQNEGHSFGDHLSSDSVRVTPLSVIEAPIELCSVSL